MNISLGCFCILLTIQCDPHSAKAFQVDETSVIFTTILSEQIFKDFLEKNQKNLSYSTFTARLWKDWPLFEIVVFSFVATSQNWESQWIEILQSLGLKKFDCAETVNDYKTAYKSQLFVKYSNNVLSFVFSPSCKEFAELKIKETEQLQKKALQLNHERTAGNITITANVPRISP